MSKAFLKREVIILAILLAPIIYLLAVWNQLPGQVPIQWNFHGEVSNYGKKYTLALITIAIYVLLLVVPKIDPRKKNYDIFSETYFKLRLVIILFLGASSAVTITAALGVDFNLSRLVLMGVLLLITILGNYMGNLRSNWFIGIRTPWTLDNEEVWKRTHYFSSRLWFWVGLILFCISVVLPHSLVFPIALSGILIIAVIPIIYSYLLFRKINQG